MPTNFKSYSVSEYFELHKITPLVQPFSSTTCLDNADDKLIIEFAKSVGRELAKCYLNKDLATITGAFVQFGWLTNLTHLNAYICRQYYKYGKDCTLKYDEFLADEPALSGFRRMRRMLLHMRTVLETLLTVSNCTTLYSAASEILGKDIDSMITIAVGQTIFFNQWVVQKGGDPETYRRYATAGGLKVYELAKKKYKTNVDDMALANGWSAAAFLYEICQRLQTRKSKEKDAQKELRPEQPTSKNGAKYKDTYKKNYYVEMQLDEEIGMVEPVLESEAENTQTVYDDHGFSGNPFASLKHA